MDLQLGLPFANVVGNPHLMPQDRQEDNQLDGIHIICNHHQLKLLLHQRSDRINPCWKNRWSLCGDIPFAGSFLLSLSQQPLLLLLLHI